MKNPLSVSCVISDIETLWRGVKIGQKIGIPSLLKLQENSGFLLEIVNNRVRICVRICVQIPLNLLKMGWKTNSENAKVKKDTFKLDKSLKLLNFLFAFFKKNVTWCPNSASQSRKITTSGYVAQNMLISYMKNLLIRPAGALKGSIVISGAKNSALPLMIAAMLTKEKLTLENVPELADVESLKNILTNLGVEYKNLANQTIELQAKSISNTTAPYDFVRKMRAGFWVIGPLLARCGHAKISLPGGCAIGTRPIDIFIKGLEKMGAEIKIENGYVEASAKNGLRACEFTFEKISVGATHVLIMAATLARGTTILHNTAAEPEIMDVINCLKKMGAKIKTETGKITIEGVSSLHGTTHRVIADRIEAGTFAACAVQTGGELLLENANHNHLREPVAILQKMGAEIETKQNAILVRGKGEIQPIDFATAPYPKFPTDLQAQFMTLATMANGKSQITETIFENRFMHVQELNRLGANITINSQQAEIIGVPYLSGAPVMATDLRASMCLVIAGLVARGETKISRIYHLKRGFENLAKKLSAVGADITEKTC